jgi:hypothetical protein
LAITIWAAFCVLFIMPSRVAVFVLQAADGHWTPPSGITMPEEELTPLLVAEVPLLLPAVVPLAVPLLAVVPLLLAVVPPLLLAVVPEPLPPLDVVVPPSAPSPVLDEPVPLEVPHAARPHATTMTPDASAESSLNFILVIPRALARRVPTHSRGRAKPTHCIGS